MVEYIKEIENDLKNRTKKVSKPANVYIGGIAYKGANDITSTDTTYYPFKLLNLNNVASIIEFKGHVFVNWEKLVVLNPNYIFIDIFSLKKIKKSYYRYQKIYNMLDAFIKRNIYTVLPYNFYNTCIYKCIFYWKNCISKSI